MASRRLRNTLKDLKETLGNAEDKPLKVKFPAWLIRLKEKGYQQNNIVESDNNHDLPVCLDCHEDNLIQLGTEESRIYQCSKCDRLFDINLKPLRRKS
jgi:hypothetical protein